MSVSAKASLSRKHRIESTYYACPAPGQICEQGFGMAKDALLASKLEDFDYAGIIAPSDNPGVFHIILEQVSRPAYLVCRPSVESGAAEAVDEDKIGPTAASFAVVAQNEWTDTITSQRLEGLFKIVADLGLLLPLGHCASPKFLHGVTLSGGCCISVIHPAELQVPIRGRNYYSGECISAVANLGASIVISEGEEGM